MRPRSRYNEALSFIEDGLDDISISRKSITWGIPVPWDPEQVIYVWVDALINYVSALTYARPGDDLERRYWPADVHLLAKDILKFHAVIWPALLWSAGYEAPRGEFIHGYLLMGGEKMSKTRGNVLDPFAVIEQRGVDPLRFYLFREVTFGLDGVISLEGFEQRYNNELANELGNLVSRVVSMIAKYRGGHLPPADGAGAGGRWPARARPWSPRPASSLSAVEITAALETAWEFVRRLNRYVEEEAPWKLAKDEAQAGRLDAVLHGLAAGLRLVALALYPVIPDTAVEILRRLGQPHERADLLLDRGALRRLAAADVVAAPLAVPAHRGRGLGGRRRGLPGATAVDEVAHGTDRHPLPPRHAQGHARRGRRRGARRRRRGRRRGRHRPALVALGGGARGARRTASTRPWACTPTRPWASTASCAPASSGCSPSRVWWPSASAASTSTATSRRATCSARVFVEQLDLRAGRGQADLRAQPRGRRRDLRPAHRARPTACASCLHCFSTPEYVELCNERGYYVSLRRQPDLQELDELQRAAAPCATTCCWSRPTRRSSRPCRGAGGPTGRPTSPSPRQFLAGLRGWTDGEVAAVTTANARRAFGLGGAGRAGRRERSRTAAARPGGATASTTWSTGARSTPSSPWPA